MFKLTKINEYTYSLKINGKHNLQLYKLIKLFIKTSYINHQTNIIQFSAESVSTLEKHIISQNAVLSYSNCIKLIDDLTKQILYLKEINYGFYGFDINDILIIDNNYLFCSTQYLLPLRNDDFIFYSPIKQPYFSSPEINELTTLPSTINYKCIYYSIGVLTTFCLLNTYLLVGNEIKTTKEIELILKPLYGTKIYWFIMRCLEEDINIRHILLI
jgi:hypothetical protein